MGGTHKHMGWPNENCFFLALPNFWLLMPIFPPAFLAPGPFFLHQIATKQDDSEACYQGKKNQGEIGTQKWTGWRLAVHVTPGCNSPNSPTVHTNAPILVSNRPSDMCASFISKDFFKLFS